MGGSCSMKRLRVSAAASGPESCGVVTLMETLISDRQVGMRRWRCCRVQTLLVWLSVFLAVGPAGAGQIDGVDFGRDVRPLLSDRCLSCHGPDETHREAELDLSDRDSALRDRDGYQVIVPGQADESELVRRITSDDPDVMMPPPDSGKELSVTERDLLRRWVAEGAPWQTHWAWVAPARQDPPRDDAATAEMRWIDAFIVSRLRTEGLEPAPAADPVTLMRRLSFDLTGLPPSTDRVEELRKNWSSRTYSRLVDEMLASEECAERLAMYWLDLVRYADTVGYHGDQDHNISPYRDWVIDSFFLNTPFDRFTREQLAGDLLPDSGIDQKIASGYNRLLQTTHEGGLQPKEYLAIYGADRVRNVSSVWMGVTLGCAQCHDHKFDPLTTRDFYSVQAFFADLDEDRHFKVGTNSLPTARPPEIRVHTRRERDELEELRRQLAAMEQAVTAGPDDAGDPPEELTRLRHAVEDLEASARMTMISVAKEPRVIRVLPRGNWLDDSGAIVDPAVPVALGSVDASGRRPTRLDLANWLVDADHGFGLFTARVMVNRFWYLMFGQGLSRSLDDFGGQGSPPDHPELLDRLAFEFVDSGWNVRHVLREIALSRTYQQSSFADRALRARDPSNHLLARQSAFRLPAEMIRDNALAVSGLLVKQVGGPSIRPYQPEGYYRHLNFPQRTYSEDEGDRQWKRGVYVHWQRQFLHPMLKAFDAPSREECTAQRAVSNTPLAALVLLNDPTFAKAARAFGRRMESCPDAATDRDRLQYGFRTALSRDADDTELSLLLSLLEQSRRSASAPDGSAGSSARAADNADAFAWSEVARAILNLDEVITRY